MVALTPAKTATLNDRAEEIGKSIGWDLWSVFEPSPALISFVAGPTRLSVLAALDVDGALDALGHGDQILVSPHRGDPRLGTPA